MKTRFNRRAAGVVGFTLVAQGLLILGSRNAGISIEATLPMEFLLWFSVLGLMSITMEQRLWPAAVGYMLGFLAVTWAHGALTGPEYLRTGMYIMAATHACLTVNVAVIWKPRTVFRRSPEDG
jgi:hypothetical protein